MSSPINSDRIVKRDLVWCAIAAGCGFLLSFVQRYFGMAPAYVDRPGFPAWVRAYDRVMQASTMFPWNLLFAAALLALILQFRFRKRSWVLAFGMGGYLGIAVTGFLHLSS